ncbi:hypothetical protein F7725_014896 [Dissostichus mawsoni]|uniref:Fibronectin type-III domain-containing protein n=1 Tax=Dissostichus mawsoni TaxID=36200 RepID=A0A7J5YI16_DISMA|nr:hypothetical protein F7725_014896 [Dissostichus mawsoni]
MSQFTVDFSAERAGLQRLHFLPVPKAPEIDAPSCVARDNNITVAWRPAGGDGDTDDGRIERYDLEYRKSNREDSLRAAGDACWEKIPDIEGTQATISGLKFDSRFVVVRVRARNKAAAGDFSEPVAVPTAAFSFVFDGSSAHAELRVQSDTVTWAAGGQRSRRPAERQREQEQVPLSIMGVVVLPAFSSQVVEPDLNCH